MALTHEEKLLKAVETYSPINPVIKETINKNSRKQYRSWKSETKKQSPKVVANDMESGSKVVANPTLAGMRGLQYEVIIYMFNECSFHGSYTTPPIYLKELAIHLKSNSAKVKNAIIRLQKKQMIMRGESQHGRGGWTKYILNQNVYEEMLVRNKVVANDMESGSKVVANDIDVIFNNLNISPLSNIGFTKEHLRTINSELKKLKLQFDPQRIQHSIYSLSHDLKNGKKFDSTPLNLFVGILKKGNIYNPTQNGYKNPEEEAERIYMESIKKGNEARKMAKEALYREKALEWYDHVDKDALRGDLVGVYGDSVPKSNALYKDMAIAYYLEHILEKG